jgi:hypothetical protein
VGHSARAEMLPPPSDASEDASPGSRPAPPGLFYEPYLSATPGLVPPRTPGATPSFGFPTPAAVQLAASLVDAPPSILDPTGSGALLRFGLVVGPGKVRVKSLTIGPGEGRSTGSTRGAVVEWSRPSRLRMVEAMCSLDWGPVVAPPTPGWRPAMVTLTLPGDWLAVAPTGQAFKQLMAAFFKRWARRFGEPWRGVWKLEFQRRGAPHLHLYSACPTGPEFREWVSRTWYEVVGSGDERHLRAGTGVDWGEGIRASDPKRLAVYFLKRATGHNLGVDKEYQHRVPFEWGGIDYETGERGPEDAGPGRFWGYRGLDRCEAEVELDREQFFQARRLLRRWARANGRPVRSLSAGRVQGGMVLANDAPGLLAQATRWVLLAQGGEGRVQAT